jgi:hypothetical protein
MVIDIAFENDCVLPVSIFGGNQLKEVSNLEGHVFSFLKVVDIFQEEFNPFIFAEND